MKNLLLTIDAGSSSCKAEVFTQSGESISSGTCPYRMSSPEPGRSELDSQLLRSTITAATQQALQGVAPGQLAGVGVSAQLGLAAVDREGKLLGPILTWADRHATEQAQRIEETLGTPRVYGVCGRRVSPEWPLAKILHYQRHKPEQHARTHKYISLKDYIVLELCGELVTDPTHASYSLLYNVKSRAWENAFLEAFDLDPEKLPDVRPAHAVAGETHGEFAAQLGLPDHIPVIVGGPDGTGGSLGAGLIAENKAVNVAGTTDVVFTCSNKPVFDPQQGTVVNCYVVPDKWVLGGPMSTTGGCLRWFCETFAQTEVAQTEVAQTEAKEAAGRGSSVYQWFDEQAAAIAPGSEKLLAIPSLVGERSPWWDPSRRGVFFGLTPQHDKTHIYRAILEGSAFSLRAMIERLEQQGNQIDDVILAGGGAKSRLWAQIRADVTGKPMLLPKVRSATNLGTAILIAVGLGMHPSFEQAAAEMTTIEGQIEPNPANQKTYQDLYEVFQELREAIGPASEHLAGIA